MNILNENEAIVINSLENWKKVAEILDKHNVRWRENEKASEFKPVSVSRFFVYTDVGFLRYDKLDKLMNKNTIKYITKDTDFIAKHSKNIFQQQMEAFYSQDYKTDTDMAHEAPYGIVTKFQKNETKQDKTMKIVVKKENGLLEVGQTYDTRKEQGFLSIGEIRLSTAKFNDWLENGYIEEVKEVSYMFEDIWKASIENEECYDYTFEFSEMFMPLHKKQYEQTQAFAKLTHVRAKILKDHGYSEDWEADVNTEHVFPYWDIEKQEIVVSFPIKNSVKYGNEITFPNTNLLIKALQHNQELFKMYLGV